MRHDVQTLDKHPYELTSLIIKECIHIQFYA